MTYTPYQQRLRDCFAAAYRFIDEHKHPRTDEDWGRIAGSLASYTDPFAVSMIVVCIEELEREYHQNTSKDGDSI